MEKESGLINDHIWLTGTRFELLELNAREKEARGEKRSRAASRLERFS